ncbi:MAG: shikimate dehydrogenase [Parcubacteria group bacterium]|nr:shikimate dehydrogenase [Parcubacteria group bacterium]
MLTTPHTKIGGIYGENIAKSMTPPLYNTLAKDRKQDLVALYFEGIVPQEMNFLLRSLNFVGISVTMPHKLAIMKYLDRIDKKALAIGAVNTVKKQGNKLIGYNTDYYGVIGAFKKYNLRGKKALILGYGGAARAAAQAMKDKKANLYFWGRNKNKADVIANYFGGKVVAKKYISELDYDVLLNTTSVGMSRRQQGSRPACRQGRSASGRPKTSVCPIEAKYILSKKIVFDAIYSPVQTTLIKQARRKKCQTITGDQMFIHQAVKQVKIVTGLTVSYKYVERIVRKYIGLPATAYK